MKKLMMFAAVTMMSAAWAMSVSAQQKGQLAVGGTIGVNGGTSTDTYKYQNTTTNIDSPNALSFALSPLVSYFVIDNLELSAGLDYNMTRVLDWTDTNDKNYFTFTHLAGFKIGANYWIPIVSDIFYYTPGVSFSFGGGSRTDNIDADTKETVKFPFALDFRADLGKFEAKVLPYLGINFNVLALAVDYITVDTGNPDVKFTRTVFDAGFNIGMSVGVRYYF